MVAICLFSLFFFRQPASPYFMRVCGHQRSGKWRERSGKWRERSGEWRVSGLFLLFQKRIFFIFSGLQRSGKWRAKVGRKTSKGRVNDEQRSGEWRVVRKGSLNIIYHLRIFIHRSFFNLRAFWVERSGKRRAKVWWKTSTWISMHRIIARSDKDWKMQKIADFSSYISFKWQNRS